MPARLLQCAFQSNEVTGLVFILAVAVHSWRMAVFYVISVILGTLVAQLLGGDRTLLGLGLFGFNSGLMGLALGNFFVADTALWIAVVILACLVGAVTVAMAKWLPIPFLAAPFIATFWVLWPIKSSVGLTAINLGAFGDSHVRFIFATFSALVAALLAAHVGAAGDMINSGFIGFNAVLAAVATYELVAADLRLVLLAAMTSTWIFSFINRTWPSPALASGFVLTVWGIMLLGWLNPRFRPEPAPSEPEAPAPVPVPVPVPAVGDAPS